MAIGQVSGTSRPAFRLCHKGGERLDRMVHTQAKAEAIRRADPSGGCHCFCRNGGTCSDRRRDFPGYTGRPSIPPGWATVALAIAGLLVLLDRFWGFTSAWVRFMLSQQELGEALRQIDPMWEQDKISWDGPEPTIKQATAMIANCKAFMLQSTLSFVERPICGPRSSRAS